MNRYSVTALLARLKDMPLADIRKELEYENQYLKPWTEKESREGAGKYFEQLEALGLLLNYGRVDGLTKTGIRIGDVKPIVLRLVENGDIPPKVLANIDSLEE